MKGFIFSIESMLAIVLIAISVTTLWSTVTEPNINDIINLKLQNSEVISLYFKENPNTTVYGNQKCTLLYYYDSIKTKELFSLQTSEKIICEGI